MDASDLEWLQQPRKVAGITLDGVVEVTRLVGAGIAGHVGRDRACDGSYAPEQRRPLGTPPGLPCTKTTASAAPSGPALRTGEQTPPTVTLRCMTLGVMSPSPTLPRLGGVWEVVPAFGAVWGATPTVDGWCGSTRWPGASGRESTSATSRRASPAGGALWAIRGGAENACAAADRPGHEQDHGARALTPAQV